MAATRMRAVKCVAVTGAAGIVKSAFAAPVPQVTSCQPAVAGRCGIGYVTVSVPAASAVPSPVGGGRSPYFGAPM